MPRLSIVIPTYDTASMTVACVQAVLAAAPPESEVIVVDDGSSDDTGARLAKEASAAHVVTLDANRGFTAAANAGVERSRGDVILLLNSDAVVEREALAALLSAFATTPSLGVAGAQLLDEDGTPQWSGGKFPRLAWMLAVVSGAGAIAGRLRRRGRRPEGPRDVDWVSGAAMAFRREVWSSAGPLDDRFRFYCQDLEFCARAGAAGWKVRIVPESRVVHGLGRSIAARSSLHYAPEFLWPDLLLWGRGRYGAAWGLLARVLLAACAAGRIAIRTLLPPWRRDETTAAMIRALRRLVQSDS